MTTGWQLATVLLAACTGLSAASPPRVRAATLGLALASTFSITVTPATVSFTSTDPDTGAVSGNSTATLTWTLDGDQKKSWSLQVWADSPGFTSCSEIPASALTITCVSAGVGGGGKGACTSAAITASTSPQTLASGRQGHQNATYQIVLNYTLAESWKYIAHVNPSCTLSLTYSATLE